MLLSLEFKLYEQHELSKAHPLKSELFFPKLISPKLYQMTSEYTQVN